MSAHIYCICLLSENNGRISLLRKMTWYNFRELLKIENYLWTITLNTAHVPLPCLNVRAISLLYIQPWNVSEVILGLEDYRRNFVKWVVLLRRLRATARFVQPGDISEVILGLEDYRRNFVKWVVLLRRLRATARRVKPGDISKILVTTGRV